MSLATSLLAGLLLAPLAAGPALMPDPSNLNDLPALVQQLEDTCAANRDSAACQVLFRAVSARVVEALTVLGFSGDRDTALEAIRAAAVSPMADIRAAAAYALANLGPQPEDFELLRGLLTESIPAVRFAAYGALTRLADERAQSLAARARGAVGRSSELTPEPLPFDPAQLGVKSYPSESRFLHFERVDRAWTFTSAASVEETVAHFEAEGGSARVKLTDWNADHFRIGNLLEPFKERDPDAVAIRLAPADPAQEPSFVAIVYRDAAMEATGFALLWALGTERPTAAQPEPEPVVADLPPGAVATGMDAAPEPETLAGVAPEEAAAFLAVLDNDGAGIEDFVASYPNSAYRPKADEILSRPRLDTDRDAYGDGGDSIKLSFRNMPEGSPILVYFGRASDRDGTAGWMLGTIATGDGEADFALDDRIEPGAYDLRAIFNGQILAYREVQVFSTATLRLDRSEVEPGGAVNAAFTRFPGLSEDAITIAAAGAAPDDRGALSVSTGSLKEGSVSLTAPQAPGAYEVRAYFQGDLEPRVTEKLIVTGGGAAEPVLPDNSGTPAAPGASATATGNGVTVSLVAAVLPAKEDIVITLSGLPGNQKDWVNVVRADAPDEDFGLWKYTDGMVSGTVTLAGQPAGAYEVRVYFDYPAGGLVPKVRLPFTVQ